MGNMSTVLSYTLLYNIYSSNNTACHTCVWVHSTVRPCTKLYSTQERDVYRTHIKVDSGHSKEVTGYQLARIPLASLYIRGI